MPEKFDQQITHHLTHHATILEEEHLEPADIFVRLRKLEKSGKTQPGVATLEISPQHLALYFAQSQETKKFSWNHVIDEGAISTADGNDNLMFLRIARSLSDSNDLYIFRAPSQFATRDAVDCIYQMKKKSGAIYRNSGINISGDTLRHETTLFENVERLQPVDIMAKVREIQQSRGSLGSPASITYGEVGITLTGPSLEGSTFVAWPDIADETVIYTKTPSDYLISFRRLHPNRNTSDLFVFSHGSEQEAKSVVDSISSHRAKSMPMAPSNPISPVQPATNSILYVKPEQVHPINSPPQRNLWNGYQSNAEFDRPYIHMSNTGLQHTRNYSRLSQPDLELYERPKSANVTDFDRPYVPASNTWTQPRTRNYSRLSQPDLESYERPKSAIVGSDTRRSEDGDDQSSSFYMLNRCLDDVEMFEKWFDSTSGTKMRGSTGTLYKNAPSSDDAVEILRKIRFALNANANLITVLPTNVSQRICNRLLGNVERISHAPQFGPSLVRDVDRPTLHSKTVNSIRELASPILCDFWQELGPNWTLASKRRSVSATPYAPKFELGTRRRRSMTNFTGEQLGSSGRQYSTSTTNLQIVPTMRRDTDALALTKVPSVQSGNMEAFSKAVLERGGRLCRATRRYVSGNTRELSVSVDERLQVLDDSDAVWCCLRNQFGQTGHVPKEYLEIIPQRQPKLELPAIEPVKAKEDEKKKEKKGKKEKDKKKSKKAKASKARSSSSSSDRSSSSSTSSSSSSSSSSEEEKRKKKKKKKKTLKKKEQRQTPMRSPHINEIQIQPPQQVITPLPMGMPPQQAQQHPFIFVLGGQQPMTLPQQQQQQQQQPHLPQQMPMFMMSMMPPHMMYPSMMPPTQMPPPHLVSPPVVSTNSDGMGLVTREVNGDRFGDPYGSPNMHAVNRELRERLLKIRQGEGAGLKAASKKTNVTTDPYTRLTNQSTAEEVTDWLMQNGYRPGVVAVLKGFTGMDLFTMTREQLMEHVGPRDCDVLFAEIQTSKA